jgi:hypothetical protein
LKTYAGFSGSCQQDTFVTIDLQGAFHPPPVKLSASQPLISIITDMVVNLRYQSIVKGFCFFIQDATSPRTQHGKVIEKVSGII